MRVMQVERPGGDFVAVDREVPRPGEHEVLVRVEACGVCHGDAVAKEGQFPHLTYPRVPGHEIVGTIEKVGALVQGWSVGQRIGVGWHAGHCFSCPACRQGRFGACERALTTGLSNDGGYAEYTVARAEALVGIPEGLTPAEAAPLLCAGSTTLAAIKSSRASAGDLVAVHGVGGLGHLAIQWATRLGFRVCALSRGREKERLARSLGAHHYIDAAASDAARELAALGGARLIVCTAPSSSAVAALAAGLCRGGEMVLVTFIDEPLLVSPNLLMRGSSAIRGWVGGDMRDALRLAELTHVRPVVERFPLAEAAVAYERMMASKVLLRGVLTP